MSKIQDIRLMFIDAMLIVHGEVSRSVIANTFGVQVAAASLDMRAYRDLNPNGIYLDHATKTWRKEDDFFPLPGLLKMPAVEFISHIEALFSVKIKQKRYRKSRLEAVEQ